MKNHFWNKGHTRPYFKCLYCGRLTAIIADNCWNCGEEVHKSQEEYFQKRKKKLEKIEKSKHEKKMRDHEQFMKGIKRYIHDEKLRMNGWSNEEIEVKLAYKEKSDNFFEWAKGKAEKITEH